MELVVNVKDFGAVGDGVTPATEAVQAAVDHCAAAGGGTVCFEKGGYVLGTVFLKSNVRIEIKKEAALLGYGNIRGFALYEELDFPLYQDQSHCYFHHAMFCGIGCENIAIYGEGKIDMRSVWDEEGVQGWWAARGPKPIALKECRNVEICGIAILNATDLAVYFAGCQEVKLHHLLLRVYIDGISPDNSQNVEITDCDIEAGDDGIVFKSSYTLNRYEECRDIVVRNCRVKSRCNAIKFGTESNCAFKNVTVTDCLLYETRIAGIAVESVDGAVIDNLVFRNITMYNVNAPLFVHIGRRMRAPEGYELGRIRNLTFENITATGPYRDYPCVAWSYRAYQRNDFFQKRRAFLNTEEVEDWQMTSNLCGLPEIPLENITLRNVHLELVGGVREFERNVPEQAQDYPEVYVYGKILPAAGIYFRHIRGLVTENVTVATEKPDVREPLVMDDVEG